MQFSLALAAMKSPKKTELYVPKSPLKDETCLNNLTVQAIMTKISCHKSDKMLVKKEGTDFYTWCKFIFTKKRS